MDTAYKRLYSDLFIREMNHLVDLVVGHGVTKSDSSVDDFKMYWDHDGLSPMITDFLEGLVGQSDCPDEIKSQVGILRQFWQDQPSADFRQLYFRFVRLELQRVIEVAKANLPNEDLSVLEDHLNANEPGLVLESLLQIIPQNKNTHEANVQVKILAAVMKLDLEA